MKLLSYTRIAIPCIAAIFGLAILALGADIMAFTTDYFHNDTSHKWNNYARIHYEAILEHVGYHPWDMPYTRPALLVAVGTISLLFNVAATAIFFKRRQSKLDGAGKQYSAFTPNVTVLSIDVLMLLLTVAATIYAWWPAFDPITSHNYTGAMAWWTNAHHIHWRWHRKDTIFDPVNWFCALYPFIHKNYKTYGETVSACQKGNALLDLMIILVLMQAIAVAVHAWSFFLERKLQNKLDEKIAEDSD